MRLDTPWAWTMILIRQFSRLRKGMSIENMVGKVVREVLCLMQIKEQKVGPPAAQETFPGT